MNFGWFPLVTSCMIIYRFIKWAKGKDGQKEQWALAGFHWSPPAWSFTNLLSDRKAGMNRKNNWSWMISIGLNSVSFLTEISWVPKRPQQGILKQIQPLSGSKLSSGASSALPHYWTSQQVTTQGVLNQIQSATTQQAVLRELCHAASQIQIHLWAWFKCENKLRNFDGNEPLAKG
jgi:hypothetical protein